MTQKLPLTLFAAQDFLRCKLSPDRMEAVVLDDTRGAIRITGADGIIGGTDWSSFRGFYFDICVGASHNGRFQMAFWRTGKNMEEAPDVTCVFGVLPGVNTRIWFDLSWLDGQGVHMPRTPGRLKMGISASTRFHIKDMGSFALSVWNSPTAYSFTVDNFTLSTEIPEFPVEERKLLDELGQWKNKEWTGKTKNLEEMISNLRTRYEQAVSKTPEWGIPGLDRWGGLTDKKLTEGTGWFATHHDGKRWWLVDPDGNAFLSVGPDCVGCVDTWTPIEVMESYLTWTPLEDPETYREALREITPYNTFEGFDVTSTSFEIANFIRAFGKDWKEKYAVIAKQDMMKWGWNTVANWSDPDLYRMMRMPYFIPMPDYPVTKKTIFRSFPDVYSEEFRQNAARYAAHLEQYKDDPCLVGYFMTNEPDWAYIQDLNVAEQLLACPYDLESKNAFADWLQAKYQTVEAFNAAWKINWDSFEDVKIPVREACRFSPDAEADLHEFTRVLIRRYTEIPAEECRKADPNHLNIGMRYASISSIDVIEGWDLFDVFSINNYRMCPVEELNRIAHIIDKPLLIGEFHFGALDVGMPATGLRGVTSQYQRGVAYGYYVENAMAHPSCVGAHYFVFEDQSAMGRFDGENLNIGVWDVCGKPYQEFADGIQLANSHIYAIASGKLMPTRRVAQEIPMIFA